MLRIVCILTPPSHCRERPGVSDRDNHVARGTVPLSIDDGAEEMHPKEYSALLTPRTYDCRTITLPRDCTQNMRGTLLAG